MDEGADSRKPRGIIKNLSMPSLSRVASNKQNRMKSIKTIIREWVIVNELDVAPEDIQELNDDIMESMKSSINYAVEKLNFTRPVLLEDEE